MARYGGAFLEASVGGPIRRVCGDKVAIEVDPVRSGKGARSTEKSVEALVFWCQEFWGSIYEARHECPPCVHCIFSELTADGDCTGRCGSCLSTFVGW